MRGVLCAAMLAAGPIAHAEISLQERYPGPWRDDFNASVSKALAQNSVQGCGEFKYRPSSRDKGEYLVYCTRDGKNWTGYFVWTQTSKIMGPYPPAASIPP